MNKKPEEWKEWWNDDSSDVNDDNIYNYFCLIVKDINELNGQLKTAKINIGNLKKELKERLGVIGDCNVCKKYINNKCTPNVTVWPLDKKLCPSFKRIESEEKTK